jgi:nucleotide-binding universal stress UspA family protein
VVLVGVDGSPTSLRAGAYAAGMARRQGARLVVVYVSRTYPLMAGLAPEGLPAVDVSEREAAAEVRELVAAGLHGVDAEFRVVRGEPFGALCRVADEIRADAVVVGASTGAGSRLVGWLAVKLVKAGRWPVTVVP